MIAPRRRPTLRSILDAPPLDRLKKVAKAAAGALAPRFPDAFPAGHFYSPLPDLAEIRARRDRLFDKSRRDCPGVDLREDEQVALVDRLSGSYRDLRFPEARSDGHRYYYKNSYYSYGDAIILNGMLRQLRPGRVVEVGSGFSSAAMLDTCAADPGLDPRFTFIDPYPERLLSLLSAEDEARHEVIARPIQDVDLAPFDALEAGDLLFVDSSHVVKIGSDLARIVFEILPRLKPGVVVHFHDIFWPFEYPEGWLESGWAWNEAYILRAFLAYNDAYKIIYFNDFMATFHRGLLADRMPLCLENPGGGLWLRRA